VIVVVAAVFVVSVWNSGGDGDGLVAERISEEKKLELIKLLLSVGFGFTLGSVLSFCYWEGYMYGQRIPIFDSRSFHFRAVVYSICNGLTTLPLMLGLRCLLVASFLIHHHVVVHFLALDQPAWRRWFVWGRKNQQIKQWLFVLDICGYSLMLLTGIYLIWCIWVTMTMTV